MTPVPSPLGDPGAIPFLPPPASLRSYALQPLPPASATVAAGLVPEGTGDSGRRSACGGALDLGRRPLAVSLTAAAARGRVGGTAAGLLVKLHGGARLRGALLRGLDLAIIWSVLPGLGRPAAAVACCSWARPCSCRHGADGAARPRCGTATPDPTT